MRRSTRIISLLALIVASFVGLAQHGRPTHGAAGAGSQDTDFYYYSSGERIPLSLSTKAVAVRFTEDSTVEEQKRVLQGREAIDASGEAEEIPLGLRLIPLGTGVSKDACLQVIRGLTGEAKVEFAGPVFDLGDGDLILTDEFIVKFASWASEADIEAFNKLHNVEIARKRVWTDWYVLRVRCKNGLDALRAANMYYEDSITEFSVPNFVMRSDRLLAAVTPDDTYFGQQWCLDNTAQDPPGGTQDADIDAPEGWEISTGSSDIVIAILDTGVDLTHEDLVDKLVDGYDFVDNDADPSPGNGYGDGHGTACAGLAGADTNNGMGVAGVAWGCKIMPIRIVSSGSTTWEWIILGIEWSAENGADVLSNSWTWAEDDAVHNAIKSAKNEGRDGKGCVVVFAVGNDGWPYLRYPAAYPEVIAVGATDHDDVKWDYSNYGAGLDVVAPCGSALTWPPDVIMWSTDISGAGGYNPGNVAYGDAAGNYDKWSGGTSAATPQVAGLAALILSMNPDFTSNEVQYIIESTADDLGAAGRDDLYGWGRINVGSALSWVYSFSLEGQLKHWWKLDETSGTIAPDSVGTANGTLMNMEETDWVAGWIDGALDFDGDNEYVNLGALDVLKGRIVTISAWIRAEYASPSYSPIVTQYNSNYAGYDLCLYSDGYPCFFLDDQVAQANEPVTANTWHHLAGTYDSQELRIYVDGVLKGSQPVDTDGTGTDAYIGHGLFENAYFNGKIDDVRIYSWAMDVDEILDKMYYGTSKFAISNESGVRVAWFDDLGNLFLKGSLTEGGRVSRPSATADDEFILQDSTGNVAAINAASGDMSIYGSVQQTWADPTAGSDDFIITNSNNQPVAYIDDSGDLYLTGALYEQAE